METYRIAKRTRYDSGPEATLPALAWTNVATSMVPPTGVSVPRRPEELTAQWLTACLRHARVLSDTAAVESFTQHRVGEGHGFAGELVRVTLRYDGPSHGAPSTLIGKFATSHAPTREMMAAMDGYVREVRFYRELSARVGVSTPRCYLAHFDPEDGQFVLLLEDLAPASPAEFAVGLSVAQAKLVLEQLAVLHGRWWNRTHEVDWLPLSPEFVRRLRDNFQKALPDFIGVFGARFPATTRVARQIGVLLAGDEMLGRLQEAPQTLAHNDLHLDNVFLPSAEGGRFALIDWQSVTASRHGTADVTRILSMGMAPELRRKHQTALLRHYHTALLVQGVRGFGFRMLKRRYTEEMVSMAIVCVLALATIDLSAVQSQDTPEVIARRIETALEDARVHRMLGLMVVMLNVQRWLRRTLRRVGMLSS